MTGGEGASHLVKLSLPDFLVYLLFFQWVSDQHKFVS